MFTCIIFSFCQFWLFFTEAMQEMKSSKQSNSLRRPRRKPFMCFNFQDGCRLEFFSNEAADIGRHFWVGRPFLQITAIKSVALRSVEYLLKIKQLYEGKKFLEKCDMCFLSLKNKQKRTKTKLKFNRRFIKVFAFMSYKLLKIIFLRNKL